MTKFLKRKMLKNGKNSLFCNAQIAKTAVFLKNLIIFLTRFIHLFVSVQRPSRAYFVRSINRKSPLRGHIGLFLNCVDCFSVHHFWTRQNQAIWRSERWKSTGGRKNRKWQERAILGDLRHFRWFFSRAHLRMLKIISTFACDFAL